MTCNPVADVDMLIARRRVQSPDCRRCASPSTPPLQPRNLAAVMDTPASKRTPMMSYAADAQRMYDLGFGSPPSHNKTPLQGKPRDLDEAGSHITPQPRAPWECFKSPVFPDETPDYMNRSRTPPSAVSTQGDRNAPRTPRTPTRARSPADRMPPQQACWQMDWNEPWIPQPPPLLFPPSWGNQLMSPGGKGRSGSPLCSPSPCKMQCGRGLDLSLESLAASQDPNDGRFMREFEHATPVGKGQFATVFRATNKLDKREYAIKVLKSTAGNTQDRLNEVYTLASISSATDLCLHLVRYFSSWMEDGDLHIQTELCSGNLRAQLAERRTLCPGSPCFGQDELANVVRQVASGLSALHRLGYAHLDVKPDNILIAQGAIDGEICYKLGDFGLATAIPANGNPAPRGSVNEGDCRYLAREVLRGGVVDVTKVDIFALGLVCYEMATNPEDGLPANGDEWQQLRDGRIEVGAAGLCEPLQDLIRQMLHTAPAERPPADEVARSPYAAPVEEPMEDGVEALKAQLAAARAMVAASEEKARQLAEKLARSVQ